MIEDERCAAPTEAPREGEQEVGRVAGVDYVERCFPPDSTDQAAYLPARANILAAIPCDAAGRVPEVEPVNRDAFSAFERLAIALCSSGADDGDIEPGSSERE